MRRIHKESEPDCLRLRRLEAQRLERDTGAPPTSKDWEMSAECKASLQHTLVADQRGLCAFCMSRIKPHGYRSELHHLGGMKIEHFYAREHEPRRMFDWDGLLGVCGGESRGLDGLVEHCDTSRKSKPLSIHPARALPDPERAFVYRSDGFITADSASPGALEDLQTLNLNAKHLVRNRKEVIDALRQKLARDGSDARLRRLYSTATTPSDGLLPPYALVAAQYLAKKFRARGLPLPVVSS